jgi:hypothetical protein
MGEANTNHKRLARNFHKTFIPERQYINAILKFAAKGGEGHIQAIAAATGIPTGESSGKVSPTLDYCRGMGLINISTEGDKKSAVKRPELTPFGRVVLLEDPFLKEPVTQWIAHLQLCSPITGADVWYRTFFDGVHILGMRFSRENLTMYLSGCYQTSSSGLIGPLVRMYEDVGSFRNCGALSEKSNIIQKSSAPILNEFGYGYGAWLIQLISYHFPHIHQITVDELDDVAGWRLIPGWNLSESQKVLEIVEKKGLISVDRHMNPWIIRCLDSCSDAWAKFYNDLI